MIFVIDTSVAVKWFVEEPGRDLARQFLKADGQRVAPDFLIAEVANVLWRRQRTGDVKEVQVNEALDKIAVILSGFGAIFGSRVRRA